MSFNDSFGPCQKDNLFCVENEEPEPIKTLKRLGTEIDLQLNFKKGKLTSPPANPNKDDILILPSKKEKKVNCISPEFEKIIRIKILNDIKNAIYKIEKVFEHKKLLMRFLIFNELKSKYFYFSQLKSNKALIDCANKDKAITKRGVKCDCELYQNEKNNLLLNLATHKNLNNNKNSCAKCSSNSDENPQFRSLSIENLVVLNYENKLMLGKIRSLLKSILKNLCEKQRVIIGKCFSKWSNANKYKKYYSNVKGEYEKKYANKFEAKIQENNKILKKLDKEKVEITIKNESLMQSIQVNTLKINTFKDKENNLNAKLKALNNEKKKVLSDLQKNEADIDNKISSFENFSKELENKICKLKEAELDKKKVLNRYVDEMNEVLDYYEKKTSEFISQKESKANFYQNNDSLNISNRNKDYRDRSSSETKLKISSSGAYNEQNFLRSYTNRNTINHKNPRPLYIKNPYLEGFNTINPDFKKTATGKYSNIMKASFLGTNK